MALSLVRLKPERGGAQVINGVDAALVSAADTAAAREAAKAAAGGSKVWDDADVWNLDESVVIGNGGVILLSLSPRPQPPGTTTSEPDAALYLRRPFGLQHQEPAMSNFVSVKFFTTGVHAGKTVRLGKYQFVDGQLSIQGQAEEVALHARALERNWSVYPEGHPNLAPPEEDNGKRDLSQAPIGDGDPEVQRGAVTDGQGASSAGDANDGGGAAAAADGPAGDSADGNGQPAGVTDPGPTPDPNLKLQRAIKQLDPKDDNHWTRDGLPAMTAVEQFYGAADITRTDVSAALPGYNRKVAAAQAEQPA